MIVKKKAQGMCAGDEEEEQEMWECQVCKMNNAVLGPINHATGRHEPNNKCKMCGSGRRFNYYKPGSHTAKVSDMLKKLDLVTGNDDTQLVVLRKKAAERGSRYMGVAAVPRPKWTAQIQRGNANVYLGTHSTERGAAEAYNKMCDKLHLHAERKNVIKAKSVEEDYLGFLRKAHPRNSIYDGVSQNGSRWKVQFVFKGTNYYLGLHPNMTQACDLYDRKLIELGLREPKPAPYVPLPEGGVGEMAKLMMEWQQRKSEQKRNRKDKYFVDRSRSQQVKRMEEKNAESKDPFAGQCIYAPLRCMFNTYARTNLQNQTLLDRSTMCRHDDIPDKSVNEGTKQIFDAYE
jgi:hypothetical protein